MQRQNYYKPWQFCQIHLLEDLQLIEKTCNHNGNQKKGHIFWLVNKPIIYKFFKEFTTY